VWKTIAEIAKETGIHRTTFLYAIDKNKFGEAARQSGTVWMIDDESPLYLSWLQSRKRPLTVIIKASVKDADYPVWAEIRRDGNSMSSLQDMKNRMGLSEEQEQAYQAAYQLVANGDIETAEKKLKECFNWVKVEQ